MANWDLLWQKEENTYALRGPSFRHKARIVMCLMKRYAGAQKSARILDVACGTGEFLRMLANTFSDLSGVDSSVVAIGRAKESCLPCHFTVLDIEKRAPGGEFDIVTCMNALEEMKEDVSVLSHIAASLRKGGLFIVVTPHSMKYWTRKDDDALNVRRYEMRELAEKCSSVGLLPVVLYSWGWPLFSAYYRIMASTNQGIVLKSSARRYAVWVIQLALYAVFFIDDMFTSFGRGRILFGVFKKQ